MILRLRYAPADEARSSRRRLARAFQMLVDLAIAIPSKSNGSGVHATRAEMVIQTRELDPVSTGERRAAVLDS